MQKFKVLLILCLSLFAFQQGYAHNVCLGNEDPCGTNFELTWVGGGMTIVTSHFVPPPTGCYFVNAPMPGMTVTSATVTRTGGSTITITVPPYPIPSYTLGSTCCTPYPQCDNAVETDWRINMLGIAAH
ncbi:MAG: hypothetical protein ACFB10_22400 [Salibacteraceae bacterium]